jgi:hypothetical protein
MVALAPALNSQVREATEKPLRFLDVTLCGVGGLSVLCEAI